MDPRQADQLAIRARRGDADALAQLYRAFAPAVRAYLRRRTGDAAAADDLLHEVFLHLLEGRGRFQARGRFRPWLFAVAANAARDDRRRDHRRHRLDEQLADNVAPAAHPPPDARLEARDLIRLVESVLDDLPAAYATAFHLRVREGFSFREMATITGDPEGTLRSRVHHTLQRLRQRLAAVETWTGSEES